MGPPARRRPRRLPAFALLACLLCRLGPAELRAAGPEKLPPAPAYDAKLVARLVAEARAKGDARRGAEVFRSPQLACLSCHRIAGQGGTIGPDLTQLAQCQTPEQIVESVLWPRRQIKEGYRAVAVTTADGRLTTGYVKEETKTTLVLLDPVAGKLVRIPKGDIEERREVGTLMPDGLTAALSPGQLRDLVRFLLGLGREDMPAGLLLAHDHRPAAFLLRPGPLVPEQGPNRGHFVNRDRVYDFYQQEAEYFRRKPRRPALVPEFPGLDGGKYGHWGNQNEATWRDDRWNDTELGSVMCGGFRGAGVTVPRGVCLRLGEHGELSACFNPDTLCYEALWRGGFVKFSAVRHGFLDGLLLDGTPLPRPEGHKPREPFAYHGFYRHGKRVLFSYRVGGVEMLDAPWAEGGKFTRLVAPADRHPLAAWTRGGPAQWPQVLETRGTPGRGGPYVVDRIPLPFKNPWKAPLFVGGHDFLPDGTAFVCTVQGDVWRVTGLDRDLRHVRWRRFASGLNQALGLVVARGRVYVLGRDQITRLHDLDGDGEADFYECFSNAYYTSAAGHDFVCGLERDGAGRFYTASGPQGLLRIAAAGRRVEVLATGMRNPDGVGLLPDGSVTVPCSEGDWTPASMICMVRPGKDRHLPAYFGYGGPKGGRPPDLPFLYLPRGLDNSSGGQVVVPDGRWGPLRGKLLHFSYGAATHFLVLTEEVGGQVQGAAVPLPGDFRSGVHRGRFNPKDGQLYVSGMAGWGTYAVDDGCFERVRYTGGPVQLPCTFHARRNGVLVSFTGPVNPAVAGRPRAHFAQAWNYRYSSAYGSPEFSPRHPGTPEHDVLEVTSAHVLPDGHTLFLEIPALQPVNQLHLHMRVDAGPPQDLFATVHRLGAPFTDFPGYRPRTEPIAAHPILADMAALTRPRPVNPWRRPLPGARRLAAEAGKNLSYTTPLLRARAGEAIRLTFTNPDVVPHNWVLVKPGTLARVGDLANRLIAEPDAAVRQYVPRSGDVLAYTDVVEPGTHFTIYFRAPREKGRYPFLCTFPGHWMAMNGVLVVE
jgi:putative heme-binding domain-containing protein